MTATTGVRTQIVRLTIGSFSAAALLGVVALLGGGAFGRTEGRVLLTTLLVGVASVAVLCYLATGGTTYQLVGVAGGAAVVVPVLTGLVLIWVDLGADGGDLVGRVFGVGATVSATLAQASLLLVLGGRGRPAVRWLLGGTLALATVLAVALSVILVAQDDPPGVVLRGLGVVAILDVLGTVVVSALGRFGAPAETASVTIPAALAMRLDAARGGRSRDEVVRDAVEAWLATSAATSVQRPAAAGPRS